jgi:hypothetical protein
VYTFCGGVASDVRPQRLEAIGDNRRIELRVVRRRHTPPGNTNSVPARTYGWSSAERIAQHLECFADAGQWRWVPVTRRQMAVAGPATATDRPTTIVKTGRFVGATAGGGGALPSRMAESHGYLRGRAYHRPGQRIPVPLSLCSTSARDKARAKRANTVYPCRRSLLKLKSISRLLTPL